MICARMSACLDAAPLLLLARHGLKYQGHLDLPPGEYALRVLVRCVRTGRSAVAGAAVTVPAASASAVLLPPLFPEPPGKWLLAREPAGRQRDVPSPFMMDGQPYVPAARPVVPKRGRIPVFVRGFNLPAGDAEIEAQVLSAAGEPVDAGRLWVGEKVPDAGGGFTVRARFESRWLEAGEYTLVITAPGTAGDKGASSSIRFVVDR